MLIINSLLKTFWEYFLLQIVIKGVCKEAIAVRIVDAILVETSNKIIRLVAPYASKLYLIRGSIEDCTTELPIE